MPRRPKPKPLPLPPAYPFASPEEEIEAIHLYKELLKNPLQTEVFHACLYEYTRHLWHALGTETERVFFLERHPWDAFGECEGFPARPFIKLSLQEKTNIAAQLDPSLTGGNFQWPAQIHLFSGTFEKMEQTVLARTQDMMAGKFGKSTLIPRFPTDSPCQEHVIFTLDYRKGKNILLADFEHWLDTHGADMLAEHSVNHQGGGLGLFSDRLQDLIRWRAAIHLGRKVARPLIFGKGADIRLQEFDRAQERAEEFIRFFTVNTLSFSNLYQLVRDWKPWKKEQDRIKEQNAHLKGAG